ncbi:hypothetical protein AQ477_17335 [Burkholderia thailandensis]|nr:hypothetical protein AQ477_17335 [Burkholderia thailandensis]
MPDASCSVPQTKSLAGVAAKMSPLRRILSPGPSTSTIGLVPDFTIEPSAFSTTFDNPPVLLPGDGFALRSVSPRNR